MGGIDFGRDSGHPRALGTEQRRQTESRGNAGNSQRSSGKCVAHLSGKSSRERGHLLIIERRFAQCLAAALVTIVPDTHGIFYLPKLAANGD